MIELGKKSNLSWKMNCCICLFNIQSTKAFVDTTWDTGTMGLNGMRNNKFHQQSSFSIPFCQYSDKAAIRGFIFTRIFIRLFWTTKKNPEMETFEAHHSPPPKLPSLPSLYIRRPTPPSPLPLLLGVKYWTLRWNKRLMRLLSLTGDPSSLNAAEKVSCCLRKLWSP